MTNEEKLEVYEGLIRELATNHFELVYKENCGYFFRIKGSKGKDKSWTSFHDFFKDYFPITVEPCKKGRVKHNGHPNNGLAHKRNTSKETPQGKSKGYQKA